MAIKFRVDHTTNSVPPEKFKANQIVKDRTPESELHFVRRGLAGFYDAKAKAMYDHEGKLIDADEKTGSTVVVHNAGEHRSLPGGRAGEVMLTDGTPQRATSGPSPATDEPA